MPTRVAENRHHDSQPDEQRRGTDHQQAGDDEGPKRHRAGIGHDSAERSLDRTGRADIAVEQQWERDDPNAEGRESEDKADGMSQDDHRPSTASGEDLVKESRIGFRYHFAVERPV